MLVQPNPRCALCARPVLLSSEEAQVGPLPAEEGLLALGSLLAPGAHAHRHCVILRGMQLYASNKQPCVACGGLFSCGCTRPSTS